jgi:hypothetical protein
MGLLTSLRDVITQSLTPILSFVGTNDKYVPCLLLTPTRNIYIIYISTYFICKVNTILRYIYIYIYIYTPVRITLAWFKYIHIYTQDDPQYA